MCALCALTAGYCILELWAVIETSAETENSCTSRKLCTQFAYVFLIATCRAVAAVTTDDQLNVFEIKNEVLLCNLALKRVLVN